jgi:hypothetical protein
MWVKQCHKPPIWEWFIYTTYKNSDLGDGLWHCFTRIIKIFIFGARGVGGLSNKGHSNCGKKTDLYRDGQFPGSCQYKQAAQHFNITSLEVLILVV